MEIIRILRRLWGMKPWLVLGLLVAGIAALSTGYAINLNPPALTPKSSSYGAASTQVLLDSKRSSLTTIAADTAALAQRSEVIAQFIASDQVRQATAARMGFDGELISVTTSPNTVQQVTAANYALQQQNASAGTVGGYSVTYQTQLGLPVIDIFTRAPSKAEAIRLANAVALSLEEHVSALSRESGIRDSSPSRIVVRQMGDAAGGQSTTDVDRLKIVAVFVIVFGAWCVSLVLISGFASAWRSHERTDAAGVAAPTTPPSDSASSNGSAASEPASADDPLAKPALSKQD